MPRRMLTERHDRLKRTRGRGEETQSHRSALRYLRKLEEELDLVQALLFDALRELDSSRDGRKFLRHSDAAQQRLHRVIKRLTKKGK